MPKESDDESEEEVDPNKPSAEKVAPTTDPMESAKNKN